MLPIRNEHSIEWADNFSDTYAASMPTGSAPFKLCLWTVIMAKRHPVFAPNFRLHYRQDGTLIPAMPKRPLHYATTIEREMTTIVSRGMFLHDSSITLKLDVRNVPLKPWLKKNREDESKELKDFLTQDRYNHLQRVFASRHDGPTFMQPLKLASYNIGSNSGLLHYLKDAHSRFIGRNKYTVIVTDCNIFMRIAKASHSRTLNVALQLYININCSNHS